MSELVDPEPTTPALRVRGLEVAFPGPSGPVAAVRGVDLEAHRGRVLGIVGESGSGKSVSMLAAMGLLPPSARVTGSVELAGRELLGLHPRQLRGVRGRDLAMVFQDPMSSLNPVFSVGDQIAEAVLVHHRGAVRPAEAKARAIELLRAVGIPAAERRYDEYPHRFSGGMRQRVVIAIAIANDPSVLIADEPTTALDVTVQAQILELLQQLCEERHVALVLISHDLGVVSGLADEVAVMYAGRVAERGPVEGIFYRAAHPYTRGLLAAVPRIDLAQEELTAIPGNPPSLASPSPGCPFAPRCEWVVPDCSLAEPPLLTAPATVAACIRADEVAVREIGPHHGVDEASTQEGER